MITTQGVAFGIRYGFVFCLVLGMAMLLPKPSAAQTDTTKSKQLNEVQIIEYRKSRINLSPVPLQILDGAELKRMNSLSVSDALRYFSGVQLKDYGGIGGLKTINVRSMGSNHTAVFYDGVQLGNAQNGQVDLGKFSLDNLEEISLYSGQKPDLLLPARGYASASSIYLKTAHPAFAANKPYQLGLSVKTGSFGLINPSINYKQKLSNRLSFSLDAAYLNADGKYKYRYKALEYDTTITRTNSDVQSKRLEANVFGLLADSSQWNVKLYTYNSERGVPGAIVSNKFNFTQRQWDDNAFVQASYQNRKSARYNILVNAKYAYDYLHYVDPDIKLLNGALDNRYTQQEYYLSVAQLYKIIPIWELSLATDYSLQKLDANLYQFAYPTRQTGLIALGTALKLPKLTLQANVLATLVDERVKQFTASSNKQEYTPTAMASWQPFKTPDFRLRAFYKSIFRMPTFNDLYYTFIGNTQLKPEYTHQYDVGLSYNHSSSRHALVYFSIQTDVYSNQVKNKIVAIPTVNLFRWTMLNLDKVSIKGIESNIQTAWALGADLRLKGSVNYTFEKAIDISANAFNYGDQVPYIPKHSGTARIGLDYKRFVVNYGYIYTGERYSQKANIPVNYIKPWYTHDVALGFNFNLNKTTFLINAEVNNLFNQYYDVVLNYPMPGRNYRLTLSANL